MTGEELRTDLACAGLLLLISVVVFLDVPAGRHHVEMRYRNPMIAWGALLSMVTLGALTAPRPRRLRPRSGS